MADGRHLPPIETRFKPGNKGGGHPKGVKNFMSRVNKFGRWKAPEDLLKAFRTKYPEYASRIDIITNEDAAAMRFWMAILSGEAWAIKELFDRKDGKVHENVNVTTREITIGKPERAEDEVLP